MTFLKKVSENLVRAREKVGEAVMDLQPLIKVSGEMTDNFNKSLQGQLWGNNSQNNNNANNQQLVLKNQHNDDLEQRKFNKQGNYYQGRKVKRLREIEFADD